MAYSLTVFSSKSHYTIHMILMLFLFQMITAALIVQTHKTEPLSGAIRKRILFIYGLFPFSVSLLFYVFVFLSELNIYSDFYFIAAFICSEWILSIILIRMKKTLPKTLLIHTETILSLTFVPLIGTIIIFPVCLNLYSIGSRGYLGPLKYYSLYLCLALVFLILYSILMKKHSVSFARAVSGFVLFISIWGFFPVPYYIYSFVTTKKYYAEFQRVLYKDVCINKAKHIDKLFLLGPSNRDTDYIFVSTHGRKYDGNKYNAESRIFLFHTADTKDMHCVPEVYFSNDGFDFFVQTAPWPPY